MTKTKREKIVVIDFETFYSTDFSLTKAEYNTSSYIRAPQFKVHCCAIKIGSKKTRCYKGADIEKQLRAIDWSVYSMLAHNTAFDGFIMKEIYGIVPCYYYDTVSMTRGLHNEISRASLDEVAKFYGIGEKSKTYLTPTKGLETLPPEIMHGLMDGCILDTDLCYEIFNKQIDVYPQDELDLIDLTIRMFCDPVLELDEVMARDGLAAEIMERRGGIMKSGVDETTLMSNPKFAAELKKLGIEPPMKTSQTTGAETYAFAQTDDGFKELLNHEDERVVLLAQGRLAAKSTQAETRAYRLLQAGSNGQKIPVGYNYFGAKTGRWSGTNKLNLQNLPRVNKKEPKPSDALRQSIIAPAGHVLVVTDSAQIEARMAAWLAGQTDVVALFAADEDVYCHMATQIYGRTITDADKAERFIGKVAVLGLGYGMGWKKFQTTLALGMMGPAVRIDDATAQRVVKLYRTRNAQIVLMWKKCENMLRSMIMKNTGTLEVLEYDDMSVWLPNGMGLHYPLLASNENGDMTYHANGMWKKIYGGLMFENIIQALARIVVGEQMLATQKMVKQYNGRVVLMTHDEIVTCVPKGVAKEVLAKQLDIMRTAPAWGQGIPLDAEGGYARNYSK